MVNYFRIRSANLFLVVILLGFMFFKGNPVYATNCNLGWLTHQSETFTNSSRSYKFSGSCSTQPDAESVKNFSYKATGSWEIASKTALEKVSSEYGNLVRTFQCDYDPWLEPGATCSMTSEIWGSVPSEYVASLDFPAAYGLMNNRRKFPVSSSVLDNDYRFEKIKNIMASSLKIIGPSQNEYFDSPDIIVTTVMERPVLNPPILLVVLKVTESSFLEPGESPRQYSDSKNFLQTANQLITYFNLSEKNLWGTLWNASAHLLSNNSIWSPGTVFRVGDDLKAKLVSTELAKPVIHSPRPNHTYTTKGGVSLYVTYQKDVDLHYQLGFRAAGEQAFNMLDERVKADEQDSSMEGEISLLGLFAESNVAECKVRTWLSRKEFSQSGLAVTKVSEVSEVTFRVLVEPLTITSPKENQVFGLPAKVVYKIQMSYKEFDIEYENYVEIDMQWVRPGNNQSFPAFFSTYKNGDYTVSRSGDDMYINYSCKDMGTYRLRARILVPAMNGFPKTVTPWTEWRQIQVVGIIGEPVELDLTKLTQQKALIKVSAGSVMKVGSKKDRSVKLTNGVVASARDSKVKNTFRAAAPLLMQPKNGQKIARKGLVQLKINGVESDKALEWQLDYRRFDGKKYTRASLKGLHLISAKNQVNGKFQTTKDGQYRVRVRSKEKGSMWSKWTFFSVGHKDEIAKKIKTVQPLKPKELAIAPFTQEYKSGPDESTKRNTKKSTGKPIMEPVLQQDAARPHILLQ